MNVDINISASNYDENSLLNSMKNLDWSFELKLADSNTNVKTIIKTIISLDQLLELRSKIDSTLEAYKKASSMKF